MCPQRIASPAIAGLPIRCHRIMQTETSTSWIPGPTMFCPGYLSWPEQCNGLSVDLWGLHGRRPTQPNRPNKTYQLWSQRCSETVRMLSWCSPAWSCSRAAEQSFTRVFVFRCASCTFFGRAANNQAQNAATRKCARLPESLPAEPIEPTMMSSIFFIGVRSGTLWNRSCCSSISVETDPKFRSCLWNRTATA